MRGQWKNKRDANEPEIIATLRAHGLSVVTMDTPADLLCGYSERSWLVEVKTPKGKLTPTQSEFRETWKGDYTVLRTTDEADEFARKCRGYTMRDAAE